jgi:cytochrome c-type biogenesis protein CcmH
MVNDLLKDVLKFLLAGSLFLLLVTAPLVQAKEAVSTAEDPVLEARMMRIAAELRCLVCQNQTIADSHAGLAIDLRNQVREMLARGQNDKQIIDYMTARYGDFVLYRPPLKTTTALLWFGPAALLFGGLITLFFVLRRRSRMAPELFDADEIDPEPEQESRAGETR